MDKLYIYIAAFVPEENGSHTIYFPDFLEAVYYNSSKNDCHQHAVCLLQSVITTRIKLQEVIPHPIREVDQVKSKLVFLRNLYDLQTPMDTHYASHSVVIEVV